MNCPSPLVRSMYADGALPSGDAAELERHLAACPACTALVARLVDERRALTAVLQHDDVAVPVPAFNAPTPWRHVFAGAVLCVLAAGPAAIWTAMSRLELPAALAWLNPFSTERAADLAASFIVFLISEGTSMMTTAVETTAAAVIAATLIWGVFAVVRLKTGNAALLAVALAAIALPSLGQALEIRRSEGVLTIPAAETIDDTLIALGESVEIDGTVTGDVIAFGRRVNIRGTVQGQLVTGAQSVNIEGDVGGSVLGFAESLAIAEAAIGRNLFGFGRDVTTSSNSRIDGNAVVFASSGTLAAPVGIDVLGFASELTLSGEVMGDVTAYANRVTLLAPASVRGDVVAHVASEDALQVSPSATVGGAVRTEIIEGRRGRGPRAEPGLGSFYAWQAVRFGAAFLTGLIVLGIATTLRRATPGTTGIEVLTSAGVGLVTMVAVPIIAVIVAITLIGIPVAILMFLLWSVALYFSKILFSHYLGSMLFERAGKSVHFALALFVGLLIVLTVTSVPLVGGIVNFLLTITGLGMLVIFVWARFQGRRFGEREIEAEYP
jgi:cytoskeletal protein CcmA (bactofilin family)